MAVKRQLESAVQSEKARFVAQAPTWLVDVRSAVKRQRKLELVANKAKCLFLVR